MIPVRPSPRPAAPAWNGPAVECWTCGVDHTPVVVIPSQTLAIAFWALPLHPAFLGFAPGLCGGGGRLLGPVTS